MAAAARLVVASVALALALCACPTAGGQYRLELVFPDADSRARTDQVRLWVFEAAAASCDDLLAGRQWPAALASLAEAVIPVAAPASAGLPDVPPGDMVFFAEGEPLFADRVLRGCTAAAVVAQGGQRVAIELAWQCARHNDAGPVCRDGGTANDGAGDAGADAAPPDAAMLDALATDARTRDAAGSDAPHRDSAGIDALHRDTSVVDTGGVDSAPRDTSAVDRAGADAGPADLSRPDLVLPDRRLPDGAVRDRRTYDAALDDAACGPRNEPLGELVEQVASTGYFIDIAVDVAGNVHLTYVHHSEPYDVWYAFGDGNSWQTEPIDVSGLEFVRTSVAVDDGGAVHIGYVRAGGGATQLMHVHGTSGHWTYQVVPGTGIPDTESDMVLGPAGRPHLSFIDNDSGGSDLGFARWDGSQWRTERVEQQIDIEPYSQRLAVDPSGKPHIIYADGWNTGLWHATRWSVSWTRAHIPGTDFPLTVSSLATDLQGRPRLAASLYPTNDLLYGAWDAGQWSVEMPTVGLGKGWFAALTLDDLGLPHLGHYDPAAGDLLYSSFDGSVWQSRIIDCSGNVGAFAAFARGVATQYAAYRDTTNEALRVIEVVPD